MSRDFLAEAARAWPERRALSGGGGVWTWAELDAWADRLAGALADEGVADGRVMPMVVDPTPEAVATLFAVVRAGGVPAPLNPRSTAAEREAALDVLADVRVPEAYAVLWTSGTEGRPRGVVLSPGALRHSAGAAASRLALGPDDRWLASLSLAHVGGLALVTRCALLGSELAAPGPLDGAALSELIDRGGVTHASLVPTQLVRLLDERRGAGPPATFRCALIGGAHAPPELVARARDGGWPLALTYGCTEMSSQVATAPPELVARIPGTVGPALEGVQVTVSEEGEILVRGPTLALGYLGSAEPLTNADGWYRTGDLGSRDEDGNLRITGRRGERIVSGGVTVDAFEVEAALRRHPAVRDACVVGLPDAEWGERVAALVVAEGAEIDLDELGAFARERLSAAKLPRRWLLSAELPLNANGKVDRGAARARFVGEGA